jgi:hypothetical protein
VVPKVIERRGVRSCVASQGPSTVDVAAAPSAVPIHHACRHLAVRIAVPSGKPELIFKSFRGGP